MKRTCIKYLQNWLKLSGRQPLVIRGARQVGKTWIVRHLAEIEGKTLIEINLEKKPHLASAFASNEPEIILKRLGLALEMRIDPSNSIIFIDEIQADPRIFAKLRWFAEDMPELPVIAAGSLLEFVLSSHEISMPVGRITYMYLEPLSFEEFLLAIGRDILAQGLKEFVWEEGIDDVTHNKLMNIFKEYLIIGGMPAAVSSWVIDGSLSVISRVHADILKTYKEDFNKYGGRISAELLTEVIEAVPSYLGEKFVYSKASSSARIEQIKKAFNLLCQARVCHKVSAVSANGVPLKAEELPLYFKAIFLDVGLCSSALKLSLVDILELAELDLINSGGVAEQVVGQLLRTIFPFYEDPESYYWVSTKRGTSAEVDYVMQHGRNVIPIEVKAGTTGRLKSLHRLMYLKKKLPVAVRISSGLPVVSQIDVKDHEDNQITYQLRSLPFYLIGELHRLLD